MLDVTVCILSYNRLGYLHELLDSIFKQTMQPKKIVIYDNASDEIVFQGLADYFSRGVEWVGASENHPFIWNFSRAMNGCDTQYVVILHDDDRLQPNFLEQQVKVLEAETQLVAISCNGFFIDENGNVINKVNNRTGATITSNIQDRNIEYFKGSGDVARRYANNSCIPFSPTVYKAYFCQQIKLREEFSKVCDAVFFCDLSEIGYIAYQNIPLYQSRVHSGQDSKYFPFELMNQLEDFFWTRQFSSELEKTLVHKLLLKQHTSRNLKKLWNALFLCDYAQVISLIRDRRFSFINAIEVLGKYFLSKCSVIRISK